MSKKMTNVSENAALSPNRSGVGSVPLIAVALSAISIMMQVSGLADLFSARSIKAKYISFGDDTSETSAVLKTVDGFAEMLLLDNRGQRVVFRTRREADGSLVLILRRDDVSAGEMVLHFPTDRSPYFESVNSGQAGGPS